ncbi:transcriptional regulator [Enterobacteriaceae bacterium RIT693]|jgi:DNA-binding winged helix-turn-helix (wHTH) protein|nr:transcriptional regulator [Enterobacteriaceae bacterium RIT693]
MDVHCTADQSDSLIYILENGVRFFPSRRYITARSGVVINLTENSYRFLTLLLKGETDKQNIINQVWHEQRGAVSDSSYYGQIYLLRKTLDQVGISSAMIKTLPRRGVKYMGKVEMIPDMAELSPTPLNHNESSGMQENKPEAEPVIRELSTSVVSNINNKFSEFAWFNSRHFHLLVTIIAIIAVCWLSTLAVAVFIFLI